MGDLPLDARSYRQVIGQFATGVTIITAGRGELIHGMTANAVSSLSLDPLLILICIDRRARMLDVITEAGFFAVNILSEDQEALSRHFSGAGKGAPPEHLRFEQEGAAPLIADTLASLTCKVEEALPGGDHLIFTGRVIGCRIGDPQARPLIFFRGRYHHLHVPDISSPAPEPWVNDSVSIFNQIYPDPFRRALAGDHELP